MIFGGAAGALIGLQFVVMTLVAEKPASREGGAAFVTPTIVHFSTALFLSAIMRAPWHCVVAPAVICALVGLCGVIDALVTIRRMRRQTVLLRQCTSAQVADLMRVYGNTPAHSFTRMLNSRKAWPRQALSGSRPIATGRAEDDHCRWHCSALNPGGEQVRRLVEKDLIRAASDHAWTWRHLGDGDPG